MNEDIKGAPTRLTLRQFAEQVNISRQSVWRYIRSGELKPRRLPSGRPFFLQEDVEAFHAGRFEFMQEVANG